MEFSLLDSIIGAFVGIIFTVLADIYFRRRGLCSYAVTHNRAAVSADDPVFGSVRVTWQGTEVGNLYVSTLEIRNESINDYENVKIRIYSSNTTLLNERTEVVGTPEAIHWTDDYKALVQPNHEGNFNDNQRNIYWGQREYIIPVLNRDEKVRFEYVNIAKDINQQPQIWMSIVHKGIILKFQVPKEEIWGVQKNLAVLVGLIVCPIFLVIFTYPGSNAISLLSFLLGVCVIVPGIFLIKVSSWLKRKVIG